MQHSWRWFGPDDLVTLNDVKQAGACNVVTALHDIPNGEVWPLHEILQRKKLIESKGLTWTIVESVPIHEDIKKRKGAFKKYIENYKQTIINLSLCGVKTICYNFMPVLDWTRTDLAFELPDGSRALRFDFTAFTAFDLFILCRKHAEKDYSEEEREAARRYYQKMDDDEKAKLTRNIIAGLPGAEEGYTLEEFRERLSEYENIDKTLYREHLAHFLAEILPVCEEYKVNMAIHPDDPPRPLFGLPRIMSSIEDIEWLVSFNSAKQNGLTMCTGSYGVRSDNNLVDIIKQYGDRIYFTHLRSTQREQDEKSFYEASHLEGDVDMFGIIEALIIQEKRRAELGDVNLIPVRPDHGHQILDDLNKTTNPGYSAIGRLKGLAEIRGVELAINRLSYKS